MDNTGADRQKPNAGIGAWLFCSQGRSVWTSQKSRLVRDVARGAYNSLGVGTTQLYDKTVVYNHKRHGESQLGNRKFAFRVKPRFPKSLTREFLLVDLVNNVDRLAEAKDEVLRRVA